MKQVLKWSVTLIVLLICGYFALGYLSSYVGWYGYKKWKYRVGTTSIEESKKRGVFVKVLHYKVEGYTGDLHGFTPYLERGFRYGRHTAKETHPLKDSKYPYQLSLGYTRTPGFGILIKDEELEKFDSADAVWGYLKQPIITDTIVLCVGGEDVPRDNGAVIKVW